MTVTNEGFSDRQTYSHQFQTFIVWVSWTLKFDMSLRKRPKVCSRLFLNFSSTAVHFLLFWVSSQLHNILRCVTGRTLWKLSEIRNVYETIIDIMKVKFSSFRSRSWLLFRYWMDVLYLPFGNRELEFRSQSNICLNVFFFPILILRNRFKRLDLHEVYFFREKITLFLSSCTRCQKCVW